MRFRRMIYVRSFGKNHGLGRTICFIIAISLIISSVYLLESKVRPAIYDIAASEARKISVRKINNAVNGLLSDENASYSELVKIIFDNNGKITGISSDIVKMNLLKTKAVEAIYASFFERETSRVSVSLGGVTGIMLFSGCGPYINVRLSFSGDTSVNFRSSFESAGENQTLHTIMLDVSSTILIALPDRTVTETVETSFCVADTVIVGDVSNLIA